MKDLEKTLETERKKLNKLVKEALKSSAFISEARPSSAETNGIFQDEEIQDQSSKVDRIIMEIYRQGG